jgi:hypothetical protein
MGDIGQLANSVDEITTEFTRKVMNAFSMRYDERKDEMFSQAHGMSSPDEYNKHDFTRVAFKSKAEIELFIQDMQNQGISAVGMPFKLNGQYIAEIPVTHNDGRNSAEIIADFKARTYIEPHDEEPTAYEYSPMQNRVGEDIADVLVVNHLESLGTAIHKTQEVLNFFGANQYGQTSNQEIFNSELHINGEANPSISSGRSKMATVINGDTVIMDGKKVTDEVIVNNVLAQHEERIQRAEEITSHIGERKSHQEKEQLASATKYVNQQADIVASYDKYLQRGESLTSTQIEEYEKAQQIVTELSRDMGRTIDAEHHVTKAEMLDFNQSTLQKVEEAGISITRPNSGVFDAYSWEHTNSEVFSEVGLSASTQALIYNINADAKKLSTQELNAEAILDGAYRQNYAVTASSSSVQTVKDPNTIFGAWTLGALEDISNKLNAEVITKETIVESKLKEVFSETEAELIQSTVASYNDSIVPEAINEAIQSVDPSLAVSLEVQITQAMLEPTEYAFTKSDTLQSISESYTASRQGLIKNAFEENPNLEEFLRRNNISTKDIISNTSEAKRKLDLFVQGQAKSSDLAALQTLRESVSALNKQEIAETNSYIAHSFRNTKTETVLSAIKENQEFSTIFATRGITVEALVSGTKEAGKMLNQLIDEYKGTELLKPLVRLRDDIEKLHRDERKELDKYPVEKPIVIASHKDLLDTEKSGALVAAKFKAERESYVSHILGANLDLAKTLADNGISISDLVLNTSGTTEKLNKLISTTKDPVLSKSLIEIKANLAQSYAAETRMKTKLAQEIKGNVEDKSIRLSSLIDKKSRALDIVSAKINSVRIEQYLSTKKELKQLLKNEGISLKGLSSAQILAKLSELHSKKASELATNGNSLIISDEIAIIKNAEADFKKINDEEEALSQKLSTAFELSPFERNMLTGNDKLWEDLKNVSWLKGKGLVDGVMTPEKLIGINTEFLKKANELGYRFVGITGFDMKYLKALSKEDLNRLGITERIRNSLVEVNTKGAFGKQNQLTSMFAAASQGLAFIIKNVDDNAESWHDVQEFTANVRKGIKYTQSAITNIRRLQNIRLQDLHIFRKGGAKNLIEKWNKPLQKKQKPIQPAKTTQATPLSVKQQARQEKYAEKLQKELAKTQKYQNSAWAKLNKQMAAIKKKVAESAIGKVISAVQTAVTGAISTLLLYYFAAAGILALFIQTLAIVSVMVICLVDTIKGAVDIGNWFAPTTYQDTVAWTLYQDLLSEEKRYVAELANTPEYAYDNRDIISYGYDGKTLENYLEDFKNSEGYAQLLYVSDNGGDIRINPFWREGYVTGDSNTDYLTTIDDFDGTHTYDISTNLNNYNIIDDPEAEKYDPVYGISNGHTSNIKDIIAMTDIMYKMDASENDDGTMHSVLGMAPQQLNVTNFWNTLGQGVKTIGQFFSNLCATIFQGAEWELPRPVINGLTYDTVRNYALTLFEVSHQQYLYLSVDYCDTNHKLYNPDGTEVNLKEGTEMDYDICTNPLQNSFKIKLDTSQNPDTPEPYVQREDGAVQFLNKTNPDGSPWFDITVSVEDNLISSETEKLCLWNDMPTEADEYNGLTYATTTDTVWNRIVSNNCWTKSTDTNETYSTVTDSITVSYEWLSDAYSSKGEFLKAFKRNVYTALKNKYIETVFSNNLFDYRDSVNDHSPPLGTPTNPYDVDEKTQVKVKNGYYIIKEDVAKETTDVTYYYNFQTFVTGGGDVYLPEWFEAYFKDISAFDVTSVGRGYYYSMTVVLPLKTTEVTTYYRDCQGHIFEYCGGHICTHEQGNVFSVTNEQLTYAEIYDNGEEPAALYTSFYDTSGVYHNDPYTGSLIKNRSGTYEFEKRYQEIVGKVDKSKVNYGNAFAAAASGGCPSPLQDLYQGSSVSHGLNIITGAGGTNGWERGIVIQDDLIRSCRDIFDCDCIILKGCNIFPFTDFTKYEGWTADNMELVINRVAMDWYDLYGFDVATEIGEYNYTLSDQDIEVLMVGLEAEYGSLLTNDRSELTQALLTYVGRGHYTMHHHPFSYTTSYSSDELENANHGFLSYICTACQGITVNDGAHTYTKYNEASCSAGNEVDIGNFVLNYIGKKYGRAIGGCYSDLEGYQDVTNLLPADIVTHSAYNLESSNYVLDVNLGSDTIDGELLKDFHVNQQAVFYVGKFSSTSIQAMKDYLQSKLDTDVFNEYVFDVGLKLSTGQTITQDIPLCIDLNQMGIYSGLRLRTEGSTSDTLTEYLPKYYTGGASAADISSANSALQTTYYWLIHPDSRTKAFKAENLINPSW